MRKQFISNKKLTREAVNQGNTAMYTEYIYGGRSICCGADVWRRRRRL